MQNKIQQSGDILTVTAPAGGVTSGGIVRIGSIVGVAITDAAAGAEVSIQRRGVFTLTKASATELTAGQRAFLNTTSLLLVASGGAGTLAIGSVVKAAGAGVTAVEVALDGVGAVQE